MVQGCITLVANYEILTLVSLLFGCVGFSSLRLRAGTV